MSYVNGQLAQDDWIEKNHPENGWFRVYWTKDGVLANVNPDHIEEPQVSFEDCGLGLRWEWEYKDGKRADGISKGWYPNNESKGIINQLKSVNEFKDGGEQYSAQWYPRGARECEQNYKGSTRHGNWTWWYDNGQKMSERIYRDGQKQGICSLWYPNGQKGYEGTFKDDELISDKYWTADGIPTDVVQPEYGPTPDWIKR